MTSVARQGAVAIASYLRARTWLARHLPALPLDRVLATLDASPGERIETDSATVARALAPTERVLSRLLRSTDTCMFRALARFAALSALGTRAVFVLGAPIGDQAGHAWVEIDGRPFMEPGLPRFPRVLEHPNRAARVASRE